MKVSRYQCWAKSWHKGTTFTILWKAGFSTEMVHKCTYICTSIHIFKTMRKYKNRIKGECERGGERLVVQVLLWGVGAFQSDTLYPEFLNCTCQVFPIISYQQHFFVEIFASTMMLSWASSLKQYTGNFATTCTFDKKSTSYQQWSIIILK
jgi:hypothetical protein